MTCQAAIEAEPCGRRRGPAEGVAGRYPGPAPCAARAGPGHGAAAAGRRAGRAALHGWVQRFCDSYAGYAPMMRVLSQAEIVGQELWGQGLQVLFRLAEGIVAGMTAARRPPPSRAELTALACVMLLERANYLVSMGVTSPGENMAERLSAIVNAAFRATGTAGCPRRSE